MNRNILFLISMLGLWQCQPGLESSGDASFNIFSWEKVHFNPDQYDKADVREDSIMVLNSGRIILKKIHIPSYQRSVEAELNISVCDPAIVHLQGDATFAIIVHYNSDENIYILKAKLNGQIMDQPIIAHKSVIEVGTLEFL